MKPTRRELLAAAAMATSGFGSTLAAPEPRKLHLSTFVVEVTPPIGHPCMGGGVAPVKSVADPLFAHGFILHGVGQPIVFLTLDWCEVRNGAYELFRTQIARAVATEPVRVMLCCLHQHDAPIADLEAQRLLEKHRAAGAICNLEFLDKTVRRVAEAAKESLDRTTPLTHLGLGEAHVEKIASNRRYRTANGQIRHDRTSATRDARIREAPEGTIDPVLKTLSFWNGETPILALSTYATHPMSYYGTGEVSADFVGLARKRRQADTPGVFQLYASGCSGNVTAGKYNDGDPANRPVLAERLYQALVAAWKQTRRFPLKHEEVAFRSVPIRFRARSSPGFAPEELLKRLKEDPKPFGQCLAALGYSWRKRVDAGQPIDLPVLDLGRAVLALLPAESYVEFQLHAHKQRPEACVLVAGYGECGPGYIPTEQAWKENDTNLSDWCWVDPGSEKRLTDAIEHALVRN
jgi:hypothetical protein